MRAISILIKLPSFSKKVYVTVKHETNYNHKHLWATLILLTRVSDFNSFNLHISVSYHIFPYTEQKVIKNIYRTIPFVLK